MPYLKSRNFVAAPFLAFSAALLLNGAPAEGVTINVLINPGFELPGQPNSNSNHIGQIPTGYTIGSGPGTNSNQSNIAQGTLNGNSPRSGIQYFDLTAQGTFFQQAFTLSNASVVSFGGYFQQRDNEVGTGSGFTELYGTSGLLFSSPTVGMGGTPFSGNTYLLSTFTTPGLLAPGSYTFRVTMADPTSVDDVFVNANVSDLGSCFAMLFTGVGSLVGMRRFLKLA